jgi:hypothetical protein
VKCPKCEHVNADGALECAQCGIVFSKWKDAWDRQAPAWPPPAPPPPAPAPTSGRTILKVAGLLVLAVGWYWFMLWSPGGLAVPEQAYRDQERGFALVVPEGWQAARLNECRTIAAGLTQATACAVLALHRDADTAQPRPSIQLTVVPIGVLFQTGYGGSVRITEADKTGLADAINKGLVESLPGYTSESIQVVSIDRIASLRMLGGATVTGTPIAVGGKTVTVPTLFGKTPEYRLAVNVVLVPSGSTAYLLVAGGRETDEDVIAPAFEQVLQSFRVTGGRATPFQRFGGLAGSIPGDAILGLLVSATLALLAL